MGGDSWQVRSIFDRDAVKNAEFVVRERSRVCIFTKISASSALPNYTPLPLAYLSTASVRLPGKHSPSQSHSPIVHHHHDKQECKRSVGLDFFLLPPQHVPSHWLYETAICQLQLKTLTHLRCSVARTTLAVQTQISV